MEPLEPEDFFGPAAVEEPASPEEIYLPFPPGIGKIPFEDPPEEDERTEDEILADEAMAEN